MNIDILKKAILMGIPSGVMSWLIYGLVFKMLIDKHPVKEALFDRDSLIFAVVVIVLEIIMYYFSLKRKE